MRKKKYLIDTDITIYFLKGMYNLKKKFASVGLENCFISEITLAELKFGAENSGNVSKNRQVIKLFEEEIAILPILNALDIYAKEKARLRKQGTAVDDFDLLIASTAIANNLSLVTHNTKHFKNISNLKLEDWALNRMKH